MGGRYFTVPSVNPRTMYRPTSSAMFNGDSMTPSPCAAVSQKRGPRKVTLLASCTGGALARLMVRVNVLVSGRLNLDPGKV